MQHKMLKHIIVVGLLSIFKLTQTEVWDRSNYKKTLNEVSTPSAQNIDEQLVGNYLYSTNKRTDTEWRYGQPHSTKDNEDNIDNYINYHRNHVGDPKENLAEIKMGNIVTDTNRGLGPSLRDPRFLFGFRPHHHHHHRPRPPCRRPWCRPIKPKPPTTKRPIHTTKRPPTTTKKPIKTTKIPQTSKTPPVTSTKPTQTTSSTYATPLTSASTTKSSVPVTQTPPTTTPISTTGSCNILPTCNPCKPCTSCDVCWIDLPVPDIDPR